MPFNEEYQGYDSKAFEPKEPELAYGDEYITRYSAMAAEIKGEDVPGDYLKIREELLNTGKSSFIEDVRVQAKSAMRTQHLNSVSAVLADRSISPEDKIKIIDSFQNEFDASAPDIEKIFIEDSLMKAPTIGATEERQVLGKLGSIEALKQEQSILHDMVDADMLEYTKENDPSSLSLTADAAGLLLPAVGTVAYKNIIDDVFPDLLGNVDYVAVGSAKKKVKEKLNSMHPNERVAAFRKILNSIPKHLGSFTDDNAVQKLFLTKDFLDLFDPTEDVSSLQVAGENILGALDTVLPSAAFVRGFKRLFRTNATEVSRGSWWKTKANTSPREAGEELEGLIEAESSEALKAAGVGSKGELVSDHVLPKAKTGKVPTGPDYRPTDAEYEQIWGHKSEFVNYKQNELQKVIDDIDADIKKVVEDTPAVHISKTKIEKVDDGVIYHATIGKTDVSGFSTYGEAVDKSDEFAESVDGVVILKRSPSGNLEEFAPQGTEFSPEFIKQSLVKLEKLNLQLKKTVNDIPKAKTQSDLDRLNKDSERIISSMRKLETKITKAGEDLEGEFYFQLKQKHTYNDGDLQGLAEDDFVGVTGSKSRVNDASAQWPQEQVRKDAASVTRIARLSENLKNIAKPFEKIFKRPNEHRRVLDLLDLGEKEGRVFTGAALRDALPNVRMQKAYISFRKTADMLWTENNIRLRSTLLKDDFKYLDTGGEYTGLIRPMKPAEKANMKVVYDPATDTLVKLEKDSQGVLRMNGKSIDQLEKEGFRIGRSKHTVVKDLENGTREGTLNILHRGEHVEDLPSQVLNYTPGYIPRIYSAPYKVVKTNKGIVLDGVQQENYEQAVKFAATRGEAERLANKLGDDYAPQRTRELVHQMEDFDTAYDFHRSTGQLFFSKRGDELYDVADQRVVSNVADSLHRAISNVSRHHAQDAWIDNEVKRWMKSYGEMLKDKGVFPLSKKALIKPQDTRLHEKYGQAVAHLERINHLRGQTAGIGSRLWRESIVNLAEAVEPLNDGAKLARSRSWISSKLLDPDSKALGINVNRSPIDILKGANFIKVIALNPVRQFIINMNQIGVYSGVKGGFKYMSDMSNQGYLTQAGLLDIGTFTRNFDEANKLRWRKSYLKAINSTRPGSSKITMKDLDDLTEDYLSSGLTQNIDQHQFMNAIAADRADSVLANNKILQNARWMKEYLVKAPIKYSKKIGFQAGEHKNVSAAWLVSRNSYKLDNPGKSLRSAEALDYISGRASEISFNMNRSGEFAYQKGALSSFFQFFSIQQKTAQALLPTKLLGKNVGKVSSKAFSGREKRNIALIMSGMYGSAGLGLNELYTSVRDHVGATPPPEVDRALRGGFIDVAVNKIGEAVTGEEQHLLVSRSAAPVSGLGSMVSDGSVIDTAIQFTRRGPEYADLLGSAKNLAGQSADLFKTIHFVGSLYTADQAEPEDLRVVMEDLSSLISSGASNLFKANLYQKMGRKVTKNGVSLFPVTDMEAWGLRIFGMQDATNVDLNKISFDMMKEREENDDTKRGDIEADAKFLYDMYNKFAVRKAEGKIDIKTYHEQMRAWSVAVNMGYEGPELEYLKDYLFDKMMKDDRTEGGTMRLLENLKNAYASGWLTDKDSLLTQFKNAPDFEGKQEFIQLIEREY